MMDDAQNIAKPERRQCWDCGYEGVPVDGVCPRCGKKRRFFTRSSIRMRGIVGMISGLLIVGLIGAPASLVDTINNSAPSEMTIGDRAILTITEVWYLLLMANGIYFFVIGSWMFAFRKRNRLMGWKIWALVFALILAGTVLKRVL